MAARIAQCRRRARFDLLTTENCEGVYYAVRERFERVKSSRAPDSRAAAAHAEMADRYEALAVVFGAKRAPDLPIDYP